MEKFTSIESFKNNVLNIRRYHAKTGKPLPLPTVTFEGHVKLHGTNAGIRRNHVTGELQAQSRENEIFVGKDNAGFAAFVETNKDAIKKLFNHLPQDLDVTLFGEWCGGNIQGKVALNATPKHLVLFAVKVHQPYVNVEGDPTSFYYHLPNDLHLNEIGVYNISQIPSYEVTVDYLNPEAGSELMSQLTLEVERQCPWAKLMFDVDGIGEGIVWHRKDEPYDTNYWFKTKGLMHQSGDGKIAITDDKLASIVELVTLLLPEWRLEQGLSHLRENNLELTPQNTGAYLKWIAGDIMKEELSTISASGFEWKNVQSQVMSDARRFYLTEIQKEF